jgi:hypothetical protein
VTYVLVFCIYGLKATACVAPEFVSLETCQAAQIALLNNSVKSVVSVVVNECVRK